MYKKIIIATDLSEASYELISCLAGLKAFGAEEVLLLRCLTLQETASIALSYSTSDLEEDLEKQKKIIEAQGFSVETRIVTGLAKNEINKIAIKEDFSLIVVGAQKHSLVSETFFGGLAYDVIQHTVKPVLLTRLEEKPEGEEACLSSVPCSTSNHILFPTDFSENADNAFKYLETMVINGVKKITLVHIEDKKNEIDKRDLEKLEIMKKSLLEKNTAEIDTLILIGKPAIEMLKLVKNLNIQLVVMGSQGLGFVKELFIGSVSNVVARNSESSVLLVPSKKR
ncbi:MAG: universal stress protein [Eubacteriales bacterium]|nr:universal stress protein [Eubacteriales bacterium]